MHGCGQATFWEGNCQRDEHGNAAILRAEDTARRETGPETIRSLQLQGLSCPWLHQFICVPTDKGFGNIARKLN
jgi:hypothetical protein